MLILIAYNLYVYNIYIYKIKFSAFFIMCIYINIKITELLEKMQFKMGNN